MRFAPSAALLALCSFSTLHLSSAADAKAPPKPCTIHSQTTGSFYDLRPLQLFPQDNSDVKVKAGGTNESYHARGYDYQSNFTINFCAPVVEDLEDVEGIPKARWANVSAYYKDKHGDVFSIGYANDIPIFRGKKLLLNYTGGSPCPDLNEDGEPIESLSTRDRSRRKLVDGDDDDDDDRRGKKPSSSKPATRHKSTLMSLICDTSPLLSNRPAVSFLGSLDHCTYVFEVRSRWACAGATPSPESGTLGPGGVFGVIFGIAVAVYIIGGVVYQRNVMHQRGWRQLPNYGVWAGLFGFFNDMFIILFSSCTHRMPSLGRLFGGKHGYHRVGTDHRSNGSAGRGRTAEDENRLIDSLDEEWD